MVTPGTVFPMEVDPSTEEAVPIIMNGGTWVSDLGGYTASWYNLISGIAPVYNVDGTVYCAAGVDLSDEVVQTVKYNIRFMQIVLVIAFVLSILSGLLGMRQYQKKHKFPTPLQTPEISNLEH
jgi:ABC-type polysaccharide transport system permease subunit